MIKSYGNSATARFAETGKSKFSGMDVKIALERLETLRELSDLSEIAGPKRFRLHKLSGNWKDFWSIDINGPWRILFRFDGDIHQLTIHDPH